MTEKHNLPVVYSAEQQQKLRREFARYVQIDHYRLPLTERRILEGENPFKVWCEDMCLSKDHVAELMGVSVCDYIMLEEGKIEPDHDDIVNFCKAVNIHPMALLSDKVWNVAMVETMLHAYDCPSLYSAIDDAANATVRDLAMAESKWGYDDLYAHYTTLCGRQPKHCKMTLDFMEWLFKNDGRHDFKNKNIFEYAREFIGQTKTAWIVAQSAHTRYTEQWTTATKIYHEFGLYLYHDDSKRVSQRLFDDMKRRDPFEVMADYLMDPSYIGMKRFPESDSSSIFLYGRSYTWKQAQREHAQYAETVFLANQERKTLARYINDIQGQCGLFEEWVDTMSEKLERFENRQFILDHADFSDLCKTFCPYTPPTRALSPEFQKWFPDVKGVRLAP